MTVNSTTRKAGPYLGNGSTNTFPFSFKVYANSDVSVVQTDPNGIESNLVMGTDYSVSLNSDQNNNPGGNISMLTGAPATGYLITLTSSMPYTQTLDLTNLGGFYPKTINDALDRQAIQIQQLAEQVSRSVKTNISSNITPATLIAYIVPLYNNLANIIAVSGNTANVNAVVGNATNINIVAANNANITNVADSITSVNTVSSNISSINTNAANIIAIQNASSDAVSASNAAATATTKAATATTQAGIATTQAGIATSQATIATSQATIATNQAGIATTQATNASNSAAAALSSQNAAATSQANAATSETNSNNSALAAASSAATAVNAPGTSGTSTTSLTVGTGTQSLTTQTGKAWVVGQYVTLASTASPANAMYGYISAYNSSTGAMSIAASVIAGSGTFTAWTIALSAPVASNQVTQSDVGTAPNQVPLNQYLSSMAYQDEKSVNILGGTFTNPIDLSNQFVAQATPSAVNATATLTIAQILTRIITTNSASAVSMTLPTGTLTDTGILGGFLPTGVAVDWNIINTVGAGAITMVAGTGHTYTGNATVAANTSATFRTLKTAANTFITYRVS